MSDSESIPDAKADADSEPGYGGHFGYKRYGFGGRRGYGHGNSYGPRYHPKPVQQCRTVYDTKYNKVCKTTYNKACELVPTTQYRTEVDEVCTNVPEKVCVPTSQTIHDKQCTNHVEEACTTEVQTTVETIVNQECQDIETQVRIKCCIIDNAILKGNK